MVGNLLLGQFFLEGIRNFLWNVAVRKVTGNVNGVSHFAEHFQNGAVILQVCGDRCCKKQNLFHGKTS